MLHALEHAQSLVLVIVQEYFYTYPIILQCVYSIKEGLSFCVTQSSNLSAHYWWFSGLSLVPRVALFHLHLSLEGLDVIKAFGAESVMVTYKRCFPQVGIDTPTLNGIGRCVM